MGVYSPTGSGNVHNDQILPKVSVGFPQGKSKVVKKKKATKAVKTTKAVNVSQKKTKK